MSRRYHVYITLADQQKKYTPEFQVNQEYAQMWKRVLQKNHKTGTVVCGCTGQGDKFLCVRYQSGSDSYFLARFPNTGHQHSPDCGYYALNSSLNGLQGYQAGVVREDDEGILHVKLSVSLTKQEINDVPQTPPQTFNVRPSSGQAAMTLLGLLHLVWSEAGLNRWYPAMEGKRFTGSIHKWLMEKAKLIKAGRQPLSNLLLAGAKKGTPQEQDNLRKVADAIVRNKRLVVIAPLAKYSEEREASGNRLSITDFCGLPILKMQEGVWANTLSRFPSELAAWKNGERIIAIALTDTPQKAEASILQLGLMWVSERWIPLDSAYEAVIERKLHSERRSFIKPLCFDAALDEVFPDFCLIDTTENKTFPLEVFGMNTPAYIQRKEEKINYYNAEYGVNGWWFWDAAADRTGLKIPDFPNSKNQC